MTSPNPPQASFRAVGWLLVLPALLGALITLVLPTAQTIWLSLQSGGVFRETTYAGFSNYAKLLGDDALWRALGFTLSLTVVPLLVAVVVGPLLALALDRAGTWPRRAGRIALSLAIVTFSPVGVAVAWFRGLAQDASGLAALAQGLREPATAPGTLRLIIAAATFGVVCALAVTAFLPALRGGTVGPAMLAVGALVALATVAVGLQTFSIGLVLTNGGPVRVTETLARLQYHHAFIRADFGSGASMAALTGVILGVLGIVATVIAVVTRMRIILTPAAASTATATATATAQAAASPGPGRAGPPAASSDAPAFAPPPTVPPSAPPPTVPPSAPPAAGTPTGRGRPTGVGVAVGVTALVLVVAVGVVLAWPWISGVLASSGTPADGLRTQVNSWVPAVIGALASVGVAYLAALGIGGLRPLGRWSEWLLLVFAPWLFVGTGPLGVANWQNMRNLGLINTFPALLPPLLVSVPALLVLTLLCKGLAERNDRDFFSGVFLPSLPMAGILAGAVALVNAQDLLWPLLVVQEPSLFTAPVAQMNQLGGYTVARPDVGASTPLLVVAVALVATVAAQVFYLDRLAIAANGSRPRADTE